jgi:hypothetical protein
VNEEEKKSQEVEMKGEGKEEKKIKETGEKKGKKRS